ncbi:MAG TPA: cell division protein FtsI [Candidatus Scatomonas merdavium]|nr:cell division protein FtsI [Candidatus Scatomonas merdavium]
MSKKLVGLFLAVILALVGLAVRITYINATEGEQYSRIVLSQAQQQYESRTIAFKRGDIVDRNGTVLATSERVYNLILDCLVVNDVTQDAEGNDVQKYVEPTVKALVEVLGMDEEDIRSRLESDETKNSQYQVLATNLSIEEKTKFEEYLDVESEENEDLTEDEILERQNVKGVWFEEDYQRVYPLNSLACDLIGFTYSDNEADWGIEGYYSSVLNGTDGRQFGYLNSDADVEQTIIPAQDGNNVVSTIDVNIQQIIRDALETFEAEMAGGPNGDQAAKNVGVVVMDPNSGEILGMDSSGWYDLNNPRDLSSFYTQEEIDAMDNEATVEALNAIWRNFCISDAYEPGSTVKPMTVAAALETASISTSDNFYCDGYQMVANQRIRCSVYPDSHGDQTLEETLAHSCNDAMMQIGADMGADTFLRYQDLFNFGSKTGIDLPGENTGILHTTDSMGEAELATSSFGQGFTCTMVQEAAAFCSVINGGYYYKPHVVSSITDSSGAVVETIDSVVERQVISSSVSDTVREYLGSVLESGGTGTAAKVEGYSMGGKTGTAQKIPRDAGTYLVSYIGFAPLDDPQVVVYVVVDEANSDNQSNSAYAQSIAKNIFTELLPYMNIFPDEGTASGTDTVGEPEQGIEDTSVPEPPASTQDETVESGGNDMLSDGITNSEQEITSG